MAKEKQKMTLNVRKRSTTVASAPPAIDLAKIEAFASGSDEAHKSSITAPNEQKVVRDAFTMPAEDHGLFAEIQKKCLSIGIIVTKSEILRAGLKHLVTLENGNLEEIIKAVPKIKTGRPSSNSTK